MHKGRLEAFSDGVIAILITIMVLELRAPNGHDLAALRPLLPVFLSYLLSFIYLGIYWNNHHHLFQAAQTVNGKVLWANLHLLFWLSLFPFATAWLAKDCFQPVPVAIYGGVLLMAGFAYFALSRVLVRKHGANSVLAQAVGHGLKEKASVLVYAIAMAAAFFETGLALLLYVSVAILWLVPDRRIERLYAKDRLG
jgi:uncharacterized membrane protein